MQYREFQSLWIIAQGGDFPISYCFPDHLLNFSFTFSEDLYALCSATVSASGALKGELAAPSSGAAGGLGSCC